MSLVVLIEVHAVDRATNLLILEHTLSTITEWDNRDALATDGHSCSQVVHLSIAYIRCDVAMCPGIQDASTVDTKQYTQTRLICRMVHVSESIHTTLLVVVHFTQHTIYHTRSTTRSSNLTRIHHIE